jgi:hypothetical protein
MICPPQIDSRDLVPMAAHYSATSPDSQSTRARKITPPDRFFLVKPAPATVGKTLQSPGRSDWISRGEGDVGTLIRLEPQV